MHEFEEWPLAGIVMKAVCPTEDEKLIICLLKVDVVPRIYQHSARLLLTVLERCKSPRVHHIFIALCIHICLVPADRHGFVINPCHSVVKSCCLRRFLNLLNSLLQKDTRS